MSLMAVNGVRLNVELVGSGMPLVLLHGFTGSNATWKAHESALAGFQLIEMEMLGHGQSEAPDEPGRYDLTFCAQDITAVLDQLGIERAAVLGYSMGGRAALHFAIHQPQRVSALILESATPGLKEAAERAARVEADNTLADFIENKGLAAFVERWESLPMWHSQQNLPETVREALHQQRLQNRPTGLANSLRGLGTGVQAPLWDRLPEITVPTLLIAGALDIKFSAIAREMHPAISNSQLAIIEGAGHAVHLEQPQAFDQLIQQFEIRG